MFGLLEIASAEKYNSKYINIFYRRVRHSWWRFRNSPCGETGGQGESCFPDCCRYNASLWTNGQLIFYLSLLVSIEKAHMLLIRKNALPSIHPNKLQVFFGSLVPLLVSDAVFLHNRFETWRVRGQRKMERQRWKGKGRTGKKTHQTAFVWMLWICGDVWVKIPPTEMKVSLWSKTLNCIKTKTCLVTCLWCVSTCGVPARVMLSFKLWIIHH